MEEESYKVLIDEVDRLSNYINDQNKVVNSKVTSTSKAVIVRVVTDKLPRSILTVISDRQSGDREDVLYKVAGVLSTIKDMEDLPSIMESVVTTRGSLWST